MNRFYAFFASLFLTVLSLDAQVIDGSVQDAETQLPIEFATIALYELGDSIPSKGSISDLEGKFKLTSVNPGTYRIEISYIGYQVYVKDSLKIGNSPLHLGKINMRADEALLEEAVIKEERNMIQYGVDKKIYDPSKDLVNIGGTATDVLQNIPSITVDNDRNIQFRGSSNITVYIDGKPSTLTGADRTAVLDQIPGYLIDRIEVISNPSAKYDAEGSGGIINIITKKGLQKGYNGTFSSSIGTRDKYQASLLMNYRNKKWNFSGSYGINKNNRWSRRTSYRELTGYDQSLLNQIGTGYDKDLGHNAKFSVEYLASLKNEFSLSYGLNTNTEDENDLTDYSFNYLNSSYDSTGYRRALSTTTSLNSSLDFYWRHNINSDKVYFTTNASYSNNTRNDRMNAEQLFYSPTNYYPGLQNNERNNGSRLLTAQFDYTHALNKTRKYEAGWKTTWRNLDNDFYSESAYGSEPIKADSGLNNRFLYEEYVHAAYLTFTSRYKRLGYSAGLRAEQTIVNSELVSEGQQYNRDYLSFFPSVYLTYTLSEGNDLQLNYSRRINRPGSWQLNPFRSFTDPINQRQGNPFLNPEFINSYEFNYVRIAKKYTLSFGVYYKETLNNITRFRAVDSNGITLTSFQNLNSSSNIGLEAVANFALAKWWKVNVNMNLYQQHMQANNIATGLQSTAIGGNIRLSNNFDIYKNLSGQLSYSFFQPGWSLQGTIKGIQAMDLGFRWDILKRKGNIGIRVSDIFNTRQFQMETLAANFSQNNVWKRESRIAYLSFSYRFGMDFKDQRSNRGRNTPSGGGGGMEDF